MAKASITIYGSVRAEGLIAHHFYKGPKWNLMQGFKEIGRAAAIHVLQVVNEEGARFEIKVKTGGQFFTEENSFEPAIEIALAYLIALAWAEEFITKVTDS